MIAPAPLPLIQKKLQSKTEAVRAVALLHAAAHGPAAIDLAPYIARMFEDPSAAIQRCAMGAFSAIAGGAVDAVPILVEQLRKGEPEMLVTRALTGLGVIGPSARSALELVMTKWKEGTGPKQKDALPALLRIGHGEEEVRRILLDALFAHDPSTRSRVHDFFKVAPDALVDWVLSQTSHPFDARDDSSRRVAAAQALSALALRRPHRVRDLIEPFLDCIGEPCVRAAILATARLERPLPDSLVARVIRVARDDEGANEEALRLLGELGEAAASARSVFFDHLTAGSDSIPWWGPEGRPAHVFGRAASALARACPGADDAMPILLRWLSRARAFDYPSGKRPNFSTVGEVALAAANIDPANEGLFDALVATAES